MGMVDARDLPLGAKIIWGDEIATIASSERTGRVGVEVDGGLLHIFEDTRVRPADHGTEDRLRSALLAATEAHIASKHCALWGDHLVEGKGLRRAAEAFVDQMLPVLGRAMDIDDDALVLRDDPDLSTTPPDAV